MKEESWIARCLSGDESAFEQALHQYRPMILHHCLSIVHDESAAEDLTQETFLHAFQHLEQFRHASQFSTWLWRIAHNLSIQYLRKHKIQEQEFKEEIHLPSSVEIARKEALQEDAGREEKKAFLREHLEQLSPKHREIVELYVFQGLSQKEIAAKLHISYGTVRSRLHYIRKALQLL